MMSTLVNGGLEEGLNQRNSTMVMWVSNNIGSGSNNINTVYNYFSGPSGYFSDGYAGYYVEGKAFDYFSYSYAGEVGIINLRTGELIHQNGNPVPSVSQLLAWADEANQ